MLSNQNVQTKFKSIIKNIAFMTNFNPASTSDKYIHYLKIDPMAEQLQLLGVLIR